MSEKPPTPTLRLAWSGMTHVGKVRKNNEDAFLALTFDGHQVTYLGKIGDATMTAGDFVFAVSDGMGGAQSGEFASRITVEKLTRQLPRAFRLAAKGLNSGFNDVLSEIFSSIHHSLLHLGQSYEECAGMGATLSLCWFSPEWVYFAHIGDSRIYVLPKGGTLRQLSHDHSYVGWLKRQGTVNEREARTHPRRNVLQQALGAGNQIIEPQIGATSYAPGDRFLICSDGLVDGLWDHHMIEELEKAKDPAHAAESLVRAAVEASGKDNVTAVVISVL